MSEIDEIFAEIERWLDDEVRDAFDVPPHLVGDLECGTVPKMGEMRALVDKISALYRVNVRKG